MTEESIRKLQHKYDLNELQDMIDTGQAWGMEGHVGRMAMQALRDGACILPKTTGKDYWGNVIPAINMVQPGTTGSIENAIEFWENVIEEEEPSEDEETESLESRLGIPVSAMRSMRDGDTIDCSELSDDELQSLLDLGEALQYNVQDLLAERNKRNLT